jgi:cytochrome c
MKALLVSTVVCAAFGLVTPAIAADAAAAQALLKKNECTKCHAVDKEKKGPSYKKVAAKYKGKADAEKSLEKNLTTTPKVKLDDGTEEEHKALKADAAAMKNLIEWILAQ